MKLEPKYDIFLFVVLWHENVITQCNEIFNFGFSFNRKSTSYFHLPTLNLIYKLDMAENIFWPLEISGIFDNFSWILIQVWLKILELRSFTVKFNRVELPKYNQLPMSIVIQVSKLFLKSISRNLISDLIRVIN